jgi:hypothetical protein
MDNKDENKSFLKYTKLSPTPLYHKFVDRMGRKTESLPQHIHPLKVRIRNALPSTLVYAYNYN